MMHMQNTQLPLIPDQKAVRVTVPVAPDVLEAFRRLAAAQGVSVGRAMGEWLADTVDGVEHMTELLQRARTSPKLVVRELHAYATGLTETTAELLDGLRKNTGQHHAMQAAARTAPRQPEGGVSQPSPRIRDGLAEVLQTGKKALTPPLSNTGGKVPGASKRGTTKTLKKSGG